MCENEWVMIYSKGLLLIRGLLSDATALAVHLGAISSDHDGGEGGQEVQALLFLCESQQLLHKIYFHTGTVATFTQI